MDSDNIVVTVKNAPSGGKTSFEIVSEWGGTIASSGSKTYGKGSTWSAKGHYGILGVLNYFTFSHLLLFVLLILYLIY